MKLAFCIKVKNQLLLDTVSEHSGSAQYHYLVFYTGDYGQTDFGVSANGLFLKNEFAKYPEAHVVEVTVSEKITIH